MSMFLLKSARRIRCVLLSRVWNVVWEARLDLELRHVKHLRSHHFVFPPTITGRRLDKWQVELKWVSVQLHAEPHLDTLLQSGRGLQGRAKNVETGHERDKGSKCDIKKCMAAFVRRLKKVLLGWRRIEEIGLRKPRACVNTGMERREQNSWKESKRVREWARGISLGWSVFGVLHTLTHTLDSLGNVSHAQQYRLC